MADNDLERLASDPTALTTAMLLREIANLKEKLEIRISALADAQNLFQENLTRVPTDVQKEVGNLKELHGQRFAEIENRFRERDALRTAEKQSTADALRAALQAQKELATAQDGANAEAIRKAQEATDKQIDSIKSMLGTSVGSLNDKIASINSRLDRSEGVVGGGRDRQSELRLNSSLLIAALVAAIAIAGLVLSILK